jgi:hypothetical protein
MPAPRERGRYHARPGLGRPCGREPSPCGANVAPRPRIPAPDRPRMPRPVSAAPRAGGFPHRPRAATFRPDGGRPDGRADPHHLRLGARAAARLRARPARALGAGGGRPALPRGKRAVPRPRRRAFRAPALRPGALADRRRSLDLRERRDPAASRRAQRRADARRPARPQHGDRMALRGAQLGRDGGPALVALQVHRRHERHARAASSSNAS